MGAGIEVKKIHEGQPLSNSYEAGGKMQANGNGNNGNGAAVRKWQLIAALIGLGLVVGKDVLFSGGSIAVTQEQVTALRSEVAQIRLEYARKDIVEQRLASIENSQKRVEDEEIDLSRNLEDLKTQLMRKRYGYN